MTSTLSPDRVGRITGSRIAPILGERRNGKSRVGVLREMLAEAKGLPPAPRDPFMEEMAEYGRKHEKFAVADYEWEYAVEIHGRNDPQDFYIHPMFDFLGSTPDGLVGDDGMVEVKCPPKAAFMHINDRPDYELQIRLQLDCTGRDWCDFCVWRRGQPLSVSRVWRDPWWLESVLPKLEKFMGEYREAIAA